MTNNQLLLEAIALKKCVTAAYNNVAMKLAPHVLYSKHSALFVDAVILEKSGELRRDKKLGAFHLAGLNDLQLSDQSFDIAPQFDPAAEKYQDATLFVVDADAG
ncbi:MAG: hypothetical protein B7Y00_03555 [Sphingomonadales bacterium 17-56-6]|nr:MAG: hypothetical protein B7Y44_10180 [Sphingomonadales bacterium 28-55-16]OYZ88702.1 MAG: hypothetical protein B7Y00_03555 [Sphingomonadales bacterium 17-56-6]